MSGSPGSAEPLFGHAQHGASGRQPRPLRILHTNFLHGWGGQSNRILEEAVGVAARGHQVEISAPPDAELLRRAEAAGLRAIRAITYRGGFRPGLLRDVAAFRRLLIEGHGYDILHLHGGRDSIIAALALPLVPRARRPGVIRTKHNVFPIQRNPGNWYLYSRLFEQNIVLSKAIADQLEETGWVRPETIRRIPSAIDPAKFDAAREARSARRAEFEFDDRDIVVAMTGRFRPEKAYDVLMPAAAIALSHEPRLRFLLLGAGSQQAEMRDLLKNHGIDSRVVMPGFRKDVPECLAAADIYVQPSRSEGLGTGVLEAAAARLPIVATRVGGIPDIIANDDMGILIPPEDPAALADGIIAFSRDPRRARHCADNARQHVASEFSLPTLIQRTEQAYLDAVSKARP